MTDGFDSTQSIVRVNNSDSQDLFDEYGKFCQFVYGNEDELLPVFSNNKENKVNTEIFLKWATDNGFLKIQELPKFPHNKSNAIRKIINPIANNLRKENPEIEKVDLADLIIQKISKECKDGEKFTKSNLIREYLSN
ncbi:hypothetical protein SPBRAN_256 [uncultured Candidatus Thioglobus sp.]|nr:hypothetical protein SPBRAN_256 [uncultured Candidatus Thioglobus sp.]